MVQTIRTRQHDGRRRSRRRGVIVLNEQQVRECTAHLRHLLHAVGVRAAGVRLERVGHNAAHERHELEQVVRRRANERALRVAALSRRRRRLRRFGHR